MGVHTIIMVNQASGQQKENALHNQHHRLSTKRKVTRYIIDQLIWLTTLILLADMAMKNKRRRLTAWWAR